MSQRTCRVCGESKPLSLFGFRRDSGKHRTECEPCRSAAGAARRYGISLGEVLAMRDAQGNRCAICKTHADDISHAAFKHNPLVIDHDHKTGRVRGLLCPTCNLMVGHAQDDPDRLLAAAAYLRQ